MHETPLKCGVLTKKNTTMEATDKILAQLKINADELIQCGNSRDMAKGQGMLEVRKELMKAIKKERKQFEQYKKESIKWGVEDFLGLEGYKLTKKEAQKALEHMIKKHDASNGITWTDLEFYAGEFEGKG